MKTKKLKVNGKSLIVSVDNRVLNCEYNFSKLNIFMIIKYFLLSDLKSFYVTTFFPKHKEVNTPFKYELFAIMLCMIPPLIIVFEIIAYIFSKWLSVESRIYELYLGYRVNIVKENNHWKRIKIPTYDNDWYTIY